MARLAPVRTASRAFVSANNSPSRCGFALCSADIAGARRDSNLKASVLSVVCCYSAVSRSSKIANASCSESLLTTSSLITCLMPPANSVAEAANTRAIVLKTTQSTIQVTSGCKAKPVTSTSRHAAFGSGITHKADQLTANSMSLGLHRHFLGQLEQKMSTRQHFPAAIARPQPTLRCGSYSWRIASSSRTMGWAPCSNCSQP